MAWYSTLSFNTMIVKRLHQASKRLENANKNPKEGGFEFKESLCSSSRGLPTGTLLTFVLYNWQTYCAKQNNYIETDQTNRSIFFLFWLQGWRWPLERPGSWLTTVALDSMAFEGSGLTSHKGGFTMSYQRPKVGNKWLPTSLSVTRCGWLLDVFA